MKKEIYSKSILGYKYFKRFRLFEIKINIENHDLNCDYTSLSLFGDYSELLNEDITKIHIKNLFFLGLYKLILDKTITIYYVEDLISFFFSFIKFKQNSYEIKLISSSKKKDPFLDELVSTISYLQNNNNETSYLKRTIKTFYSKYVGFEYNPKNHYRVFSKKLLDTYFKNHDFIKRETNVKENLTKFIIEEEFSIKAYLQIKNLKKNHKLTLKNNQEYRLFNERINSILDDYFYFLDNDN